MLTIYTRAEYIYVVISGQLKTLDIAKSKTARKLISFLLQRTLEDLPAVRPLSLPTDFQQLPKPFALMIRY
jgi:hypothetical protein